MSNDQIPTKELDDGDENVAGTLQGRKISMLEAALVLRYQGRLLSAHRLLDEAERIARAERDNAKCIQVKLSEIACWMDRGAFAHALRLTSDVTEEARRCGLEDRLPAIERTRRRVVRSRIGWWLGVGFCVVVLLGGTWWNPLPLDERLSGLFPPWVAGVVPLMQFGGVALALAQILGVLFLTRLDERHLADRFRYPHLILLGLPFALLLFPRMFLSTGTMVPSGLVVAQAYLVLLPLAALLVLIPLVERWRRGWRPATELAVGLLLLVFGFQTPSTTDILVVTEIMSSDSSFHDRQAKAWLELTDKLHDSGYRGAHVAYVRGAAFSTLKDDDNAAQAFEKALELDPTHLSALNDYAWLLLKTEKTALHDVELAQELAERALENGGNEEAYALDTYAEALFQAGKAKEAVTVERRALELAQAVAWYERSTEGYLEQLERFEEGLPSSPDPAHRDE